MQHIERGKEALAAYHAYLQGDHDYRLWVEVLTLEEREVTEVDVLDGQMNFAKPDDNGPERVASLVLSDPEGALEFGTSYASDDTGTLWVNRLLRVKHEVEVPAHGVFTTTCVVGLPLAVSRTGGEVNVEIADKSVLAHHGVRPRTYKKGTNVRVALVSILRDLTGERNFRIPKTKKKLSRPYTVGMGEDALTPWEAFKRIAGKEKGWRAYYSADGYATCEPTQAAKGVVQVDHVLSLPDASTSFTDFINYVKVTSRRKMRNKKKDNEAKKRDATIVFEGVAMLPDGHRLSAPSLARHGVPRLLPLVVDDDDLKSAGQVNDRTRAELKAGSEVESEQAVEVMPFFHLDTGDKLSLPLGIGNVAFDECSIPFGVGGNMTLGTHKWVSRPVKVRRVRSKKTVQRKKKKGGKKNDG
jgi:hypothetical protein